MRKPITDPESDEASPVNPGWKITGPVESMQPTTTVDNNIFFSGRSGLKMESSNPNCHGRAVQTFGITGDQTYLVTARFRTENISSVHKNVLIRVKWFRGKEQLGYNYIYTIEGESDGWFHASDRIKAVKGSTTAELSLEFRWSTGTVWWDDISFEACAEELPRKIKVGTFYFRPPGPTVEKNIALMSEMIDKAGKEGCTIICLPEGWPTCNTGLGMQKTESNTLEGSAAMMFEKAKSTACDIVSVFTAGKEILLKNVAVLYGRTGKIEGYMKKCSFLILKLEAELYPEIHSRCFN